MPAAARGRCLSRGGRTGAEVRPAGEEMTREKGKLSEARRSAAAINIFRYFAGKAADAGRCSVQRDRVHMWRSGNRWRFRVGDAVEFSDCDSGMEDAPALICGNTIVVKPTSVSPLSTWRIVEACRERGSEGRREFRRWIGGTLGKSLIQRSSAEGCSFTDVRSRRMAARGSVEERCGFSWRWAKESDHRAGGREFRAGGGEYGHAAFFRPAKMYGYHRVIVEDAIYERSCGAGGATKKLKSATGWSGHRHRPAVDEGQLETDLKYIEMDARKRRASVGGIG